MTYTIGTAVEGAKKMIRFAVAALALLPSIALAREWDSDWRYVATSGRGEVTRLKYSSIRNLPPTPLRPFSVRQAWVSVVSRRPENPQEAYALQLERYNCDEQTWDLYSFSSYREDGSAIKTSTRTNDLGSSYTPVVPGSLGDETMKQICEAPIN
ncbi:surface-adhesin E family protein [Novosphingobium olei]|uniref:surface-adhesin E family protein n=1 Tax=Novosphingobium olei TaxID=2728851 RepID=UPI00308777D8|nr:hypothetical protein NSDW_10680 [Novosphingobium olei]